MSSSAKAIIDKLAKHVIAAARDADTIAHLAKLGVEPGGDTPEEFAAQIKSEQPKFDAAISGLPTITSSS